MMSMESSSLMMGEMYTMDMAALLMRMLRLGPAVLCNKHLQVMYLYTAWSGSDFDFPKFPLATCLAHYH